MIVSDYSKKHYQGTEEQREMNKWLIRLAGKRNVKFISPEINQEIQDQFKVLWKNDHGNLILESQYIQRLSYQLKDKVLGFIFEDEIARFNSFLTGCDRDFKHKIISSMCPRHVLGKGTEIITADIYGQELYFILKNKILVMKDEEEILILPEYSYFGEDLLIFNNKSDYSYLLHDNSVDLFVISKVRYMDILKLLPQENDRAEKRSYLRRKYLERVAIVIIELVSTGASYEEKVFAVDAIQHEFLDANGILSYEQTVELENLLQESLFSENRVIDLQGLTDNFISLNTRLNRVANCINSGRNIN